jgi:hypothetical protein
MNAWIRLLNFKPIIEYVCIHIYAGSQSHSIISLVNNRAQPDEYWTRNVEIHNPCNLATSWAAMQG